MDTHCSHLPATDRGTTSRHPTPQTQQALVFRSSRLRGFDAVDRILIVKADLERELEDLVLNCRRCGLDVHWVAGITPEAL